jgi:PAS domain S-box-containing protein
MPPSDGQPLPSGEASSQAEKDLALLFALSLDLLCVAGLDGYFKRVNPAWTRVLGWSEAELLARPVADFMHPEDRERTIQARAGLARGIPVQGLENRYLCKDGSHRWLSWQSVAEPGAATVFAVARDITERRKRDQETLLLGKLESTGTLAGGLAHDFNNLLATLALNLDMIPLCGSTNSEQEQHLNQARQTVRAAKLLTDQLLAFARGSGSSHRLCNLKQVLQDSVTAAMMGSSVAHECRVVPDLWPVEVDPVQIAQVLRGLLLNAREATPSGGMVRVEAENVSLPIAAPAPGPGDWICIRVVDNGTGIAPDVLSRVFDPYFSTKQRGTQKGMGMGLTTCRAVIREHRGTITIESRPNLGTTVTCHLPAWREAARERASQI